MECPKLTSLVAWYNSASPVWYAIRAAGLTSYILLFLSVVLGILQSLSLMGKWWRRGMYTVHCTACFYGLMFGMLHGFLLLFDNYSNTFNYTLRDILVPFASNYMPLQTSLGILSLYIMFVLVATSKMIKYLGRKFWKAIHYLAFPGYIFALYHGVSIGTDSRYGDIKLLYTLTGCIVLALIFLRLSFSRRKPDAKGSSPVRPKYYQNQLQPSDRHSGSIARPVRPAPSPGHDASGTYKYSS
jgi:predicted ferric reductase